MPDSTVPGVSLKAGNGVAVILQGRLHALNDLQLTVKHTHWAVVGLASGTEYLAAGPGIPLTENTSTKKAAAAASKKYNSPHKAENL